MQEANEIAFGGLLGIGTLGVGLTWIGFGNCSGRNFDIAVAYTPALSHIAHTSRRLYKSLSVGSLKELGGAQSKHCQGSSSGSCIQSVQAGVSSAKSKVSDVKSDSTELRAFSSSVPTGTSSGTECSSSPCPGGLLAPGRADVD